MKTPSEIIDELIKARAANNENWGELIRLAWEAAPERAREISQKINSQDKIILGIAEALSKANTQPKQTTQTKKAVLLPGGGVLHTYAVKEALVLGLQPIVTDRDPNCPCAKIPGVEFHQIDCYDVASHLKLVASEWGVYLIGSFCGGADTHVVVASVHEAMGWNGRWVSRQTAETCKDKLLAKEALIEAGVATASLVDPQLVDGMICKPRIGSGSRGVRRYLGPMGSYCGSDSIHEELLEGPEQSAEILIVPGGYRAVNVVDRHFAWVNDQPLEWGHTNPTLLDESTKAALYDLCFKAAKAVGADVGFFKIDSILTKDGPKVLECTPRLSGGYDSQISTPMSSGRNPLRYGIQLACGLPLDESLLEITKRERVTIIHRPELASALLP